MRVGFRGTFNPTFMLLLVVYPGVVHLLFAHFTIVHVSSQSVAIDILSNYVCYLEARSAGVQFIVPV